MASEADNLATALANVAEKLAEMTANPRVSYSIDGQSVSWGDYFNSLTKLRNDLKAALVNAQGPFEIHVTPWS